MGIGSETPKCFLDAMRGLRAKGYYKSIAKIKQILNLENYPQAKIEVLLIEATKEYFSKDDTADNRLNIDTVLVDFGLLQGYNNRSRDGDVEIKIEKNRLTERREKFLKESTYIIKRQPKYCHTYRDLQDKKNLMKGVNSLGSSTRLRIDNVGKFIYNKRNYIEQYIDEIMKNYKLSNFNCLEDNLLPVLFSIRQESITEEGSISDCINSILEAEYHDVVAKDLYKALCGEDDPPDKEWVATWLTNCIYDKFKNTIDRDIMLVSFALLPDYELKGKDGLEHRLNKYLRKSIYYDTHPCTSRDPIEDILDNETKEKTEIKNKLRIKEKKLVNEFIEHIKTIDYSKHIEDIKGYKTSFKRKHSHACQSQGMLFSRKNIEIAQKIQEIREITINASNASIVSIFISSCIFLVICLGMQPLQNYIAQYEKQLTKTIACASAWERDGIDQDARLIERTSKGNNKEFYGEPVQIEWSNDTNLIPLKDTEDAG